MFYLTSVSLRGIRGFKSLCIKIQIFQNNSYSKHMYGVSNYTGCRLLTDYRTSGLLQSERAYLIILK